MEDKRIKMESFRELRHKVTANTVTMVVFNDTKPNTAFIRNYGSTDLYVSTRSNPSTTNYDQVIPSGAVQSLVKLQPFDRLFMVSTGDCDVETTTFENADIRPADIPETQQIVFINTQPITLGNIEKINQPLPAGDNNIGNVDIASSLPAGTNVIGKVMPTDNNDNNGQTLYHYISQAGLNATVVKNSQTKLKFIRVSNLTAVNKVMKLYDKATAPTVGTDVPKLTIFVRASQCVDVNVPETGFSFLNGLSFGMTSGVADNDTGSITAGDLLVNMSYI